MSHIVYRCEVEDLREVIEQLESERQMMTKKVERLEKEVKKQRRTLEDSDHKVQQMHDKLNQVRAAFCQLV